mmetsp:Transcript_52181/g.167194  ORF Transcript_52181/g.167194 Transcript_52181/m.167194 type:complete len:217 (+) Transcript_52181:188-838(+)
MANANKGNQTAPLKRSATSPRTISTLVKTLRSLSSRRARPSAASNSASLHEPASRREAVRKNLSTITLASSLAMPVARSMGSGKICSQETTRSMISSIRRTRPNACANGRQSPPFRAPSCVTLGAKALAKSSGVTAIPTSCTSCRMSSGRPFKSPARAACPACANCQSPANEACNTASRAVRLPKISVSSRRARRPKKAEPSADSKSCAGRASFPE